MPASTITHYLILLGIASSAWGLNFPLSKSRETCLVITQGHYEFEYVVSGHTEKEVRCLISELDRVIYEIRGKSEFEAEFEVTQGEASVCFSSLDTLPKSVSVDFMKTDDPLRGLIKDQDKMRIH